jgi:DNA-binding response OmpR family regulator
MSRILLLFAHLENRRLLAEALGSHGHEVAWPDTPGAIERPPESTGEGEHLLSGTFDLCILDVLRLEALAGQIRARREAEAPLFLPFLLASPRQEPSIVARYLRGMVDEWLSTPVHKVELLARVETLLRLRRLSYEAASRARLEGILLAARTLEHEVSNKLVATAGYTERLAGDPALSPHLQARAARAHQGAKEAAAIIRQVLSLTEVARTGDLPITDWGDTGGKTIDLSAA